MQHQTATLQTAENSSTQTVEAETDSRSLLIAYIPAIASVLSMLRLTYERDLVQRES